jgi:hypothetical protein
MSANGKRTRARLRGFNLKPGWQTYYDIGVELSKQLAPVQPLTAVARRFGISKQKAYHETMVALGKLAYRLSVAVNSELEVRP